MANKRVEGLWVVTAVCDWKDYGPENETEYRCKPSIATTMAGKNAAVRAAWNNTNILRVEVECYATDNPSIYDAPNPNA